MFVITVKILQLIETFKILNMKRNGKTVEFVTSREKPKTNLQCPKPAVETSAVCWCVFTESVATNHQTQ